MKVTTTKARIQQLLALYGLNQTEFCDKTKITKSALSNYLNGDRIPRQEQISKIADAFNISPAWVMGYDVPMLDNHIPGPDTLPMAGRLFFQDEYNFVIENSPKSSKVDIDRIKRYCKMLSDMNVRGLLDAADGCTGEQIQIATNVLNSYKPGNNSPKQ